MSEEQLTALLAKLKQDAALRQKLQAAGDLDAAVELAQAAGFEVSKADWLKYQSQDIVELGDEDLEAVAGGGKASEYREYCRGGSLYTTIESHC